MYKFADRVYEMRASADVVRGLYNSMTTPGLISFGGGAPANETLPIEILNRIASSVFTVDGKGITALQYGKPDGTMDLRETINRQLIRPYGLNVDTEKNIFVTGGGMEGIYIVCQLFINPGDVILVEAPTFVQSAEVFEMFQAKCIACDMDENGLIVDGIEEKIKKYNPKMIYTIPTFHNPTGRTLSKDRRIKLASIAKEYNTLVFEDDPYKDLRYSGEELLPIKAYDTCDNVISGFSFSKIFAPGARLGYLIAHEDIIERAFDIKTATNSHTTMISQVLCNEFFEQGYFDEHLQKLRDLYRGRRDAMVDSIVKFFPEGTNYTSPDGGLFTWAELPGDIDTGEILEEAVTKFNVAYLPGEKFFTEGNGKGKNCIRLSFGNVKEEDIYSGMEKLGNFIKSKLQK